MYREHGSAAWVKNGITEEKGRPLKCNNQSVCATVICNGEKGVGMDS